MDNSSYLASNAFKRAWTANGEAYQKHILVTHVNMFTLLN